MNVHGKNHVAAGAFGRHVPAVTLVTGRGTVCSVGSAPDGPALSEVLGAQGLTGIMVDVTLQLKKIHSGFLEVEAEATPSLTATFDALDVGSAEADYTVAWVDCAGRRAGRGVLHHAWYLEPDHELAGRGLAGEAQNLPSRIAGLLPREHAWRALEPFMSRAGIRVLNGGKYRSAALRRRHRYVQSHAAFHFLLDYMPGWKRAYGSSGMIQYQLFVPAASAREAFAEALKQQEKLGVPSYLGVMKRHTPEDSAATYCLDGYSLALDFPVGRGEAFGRLMRLCRSLDRIVQESGGRIYAAKDSVSVGRLPERRDPAFSSNLARRWERGG
jgi:FAD/FMN-containing dehydrogenase